ncbi:MAG: hypothetical protein AAB839_01680 [Patescibacteria group bacterium]
MMLFVNGSDIASLSLGIVTNDRAGFSIDPVQHLVRPEEYLAMIDAFCTEHAAAVQDLSGIVAVLGPGSATALRSSLSFVNTFAFARSLPIFGVTLEQAADDRAVLIGLRQVVSAEMVRPVYANAARITVSGKDALGRDISRSPS